MSEPKFYIIIPTRNRHDTLRYALQTCTQQDYDNLEVIVSDNFSSPETRAVAAASGDHRVRYQRSEKPLSMRDSWEFSISTIQSDGFVHIMGDDNGLLPGALRRIAEIVRRTGTKALNGQAVQYLWPDVEGHSSRIEIPFPGDDVTVNAQRTLAHAFRLRIGWDKLPNINMGFVHTSVMAMVRRFSGGRYFAAALPDVYSAVANAMCLDTYVCLNRAVAVNGASRHSNGMAGGTDGKMTFTADTLAGGYHFHPKFPVNQAYHMGTYEAFMVAADNAASGLGKKYVLDPETVLKNAIRKEYVLFHRNWIAEELSQFASLNGLKTRLPVLGPAPERAPAAPRMIELSGDRIVLGCDLVTLPDVLAASRFAENILARPELLPAALLKPSLRARAKLYVIQHILMGASPLPQ